MLGTGGAAVLPCAGGHGDQPAALMDAFQLLDGFAKAPGDGEGEDR